MEPDFGIPHSADPDVTKLRRHLRILVDLSKLAGEAVSLDRFLDQCVLHVARAVEVDHVKVLRYQRASSDLLILAGIGWKEGIVGSAALPADLRSPPGRAFQTAEPIVIPDCSDASGYLISDLLKEHSIVSLANVPVLINGAAWGVLEVDSTILRDFTQDTVEFLTATAALIGVAMRREGSEETEGDRLAAAALQAHAQDVLLRELQHRVKNNFQLILASISLQKRRLKSKETEHALNHVADRINAISLAHDQLAPRDGNQVVDLSAYLRALCNSIQQQVDDVAIDIEADRIELTIDRAVPLGLILNEAATNSVKHAFDDKGGRIEVRLQSGVGYGEARLTITDNGRGVQNPRPGGTGTNLMASLARQIGGTIDRASSERGTITTLTFPVFS